MNYTHLMNLAGQGIGRANNFCVLSSEDISNDEDEMGITKGSHLKSMTMATVGTQPFVINPITLQSRSNQE